MGVGFGRRMGRCVRRSRSSSSSPASVMWKISAGDEASVVFAPGAVVVVAIAVVEGDADDDDADGGLSSWWGILFFVVVEELGIR